MFIIGLLWYCIGFAQLPSTVKHIEIISDVSDTMALVNKSDIDKINTAFYRLKYADSLNTINNNIILLLNDEKSKLESILSEQNQIINNKDTQISIIRIKNRETISNLEKQVKDESRKKTIWEGATFFSLIAIIAIIIL